MNGAVKRIECPPELNQETGRQLLAGVQREKLPKGATLLVDLSGVREMDARGGAWLVALAGWARSRGGEFRWEGQQGRVAEFIDLIEPGLIAGKGIASERESVLARAGARVLDAVSEARDAANLIVDAVYWTVMAPVEGRGLRWGLLLDEIYEMGVRAVPINSLMNFLLGLTIAMLTAAQVAPLGLGIFVAGLIMVGFARELAALMTAVVVSARTGAAIAAELATMKVQEEIDALKGMGLQPPQFLVAPKLLALLIVMPCLICIGIIAGILGGSVWGIFVLGFRPDSWFNETLAWATLDDLAQGLLKGFSFAIIIVLVGCHNGLRVTGGSRGVGLMTTRAVVMDIFFIVVIDMIFAAIFYYVLD